MENLHKDFMDRHSERIRMMNEEINTSLKNIYENIGEVCTDSGNSNRVCIYPDNIDEAIDNISAELDDLLDELSDF